MGTQTHFTCEEHNAPLHQKSPKMCDKKAAVKEVEKFDQGNLKKTETQEKNTLPNADTIKDEKKANEEKACIDSLCKEVKKSCKEQLKPTCTKECNQVPTQEQIDQEKKAMKEGK